MRALVTSRLLFRRVMPSISRRGAHGHEMVNPGPPVTLDYIPIPHQPYKSVYGMLQKKFNQYLAISAALFVSAFALAAYDGVFMVESLSMPRAYRNREKLYREIH